MTTSLLPPADELAGKIKDAYYHARDNGGTMHTAGDAAAQAVLDLFHRSLDRIVAEVNKEMPPPPTTKQKPGESIMPDAGPDRDLVNERLGWIRARDIVARQAR